MKIGRANTWCLPAVVLVCLLVALALGCHAAGPQLSAAELKALTERRRQAEELFRHTLANAGGCKEVGELLRNTAAVGGASIHCET